MTHQDLKEAAMKATPGPWFNDGGIIWYDSREQVCCGKGYQECCGQPDIKGGQEQLGEASEKNATFIALANPARILSLIEGEERMREALETVCSAVESSGTLTDRWSRTLNAVISARAALKEKPHD